MKIEKLDFRKLPFSRLFFYYLEQNESITACYNRKNSYEELKKAVSSFRFHGERRKAARLIADFNSGFSTKFSPKELEEILCDDNTVTITTGQQLSLLGGPLYTVFKAMTAIHLANALSRDTGRKVIPVFWLADEDHDFEEISEVTLPDNNSLRKITLPCSSCISQAAGTIPIHSDFEAFRTRVFETLKVTDFYQQLTTLLEESYATGKTYRDAFGTLLLRIFSGHGLILAGSNFRQAKEFLSGCIEKAIIHAEEIRTELSDQSKLIGQRYHQQVQITDSLLFWHDEQHGRLRLKHENGTWSREPGISMTTDQLLMKLDSEPDRFSPNVFLRPIMQDTLLPNVAYVGGPAEIAYYGQMKPLYDLFGLEMPFIASRLSATLAEPALQRFLGDLPFELPDYTRRIEELEQLYLRTYGNPDLDDQFDVWKKRTEDLTRKMTAEIGITDPGLLKHSGAVTKEHIKSIDKLRKKMVHAMRQKEEIQISRIKKAKNALFPNDRLQEREISFIYFMNKFGMDIWDRILDEINNETNEFPLFSKHLIINL